MYIPLAQQICSNQRKSKRRAERRGGGRRREDEEEEEEGRKEKSLHHAKGRFSPFHLLYIEANLTQVRLWACWRKGGEGEGGGGRGVMKPRPYFA